MTQGQGVEVPMTDKPVTDEELERLAEHAGAVGMRSNPDAIILREIIALRKRVTELETLLDIEDE